MRPTPARMSPGRTSAAGERPHESPDARLDLYWIPLGMGTPIVAFFGRVYEAMMAACQRRPSQALYHCALLATIDGERIAIEMAPVPDRFGPAKRGVIIEGPVGTRWLRRFRVFRYEIRCWRGGELSDLTYAVGGPVVLTRDRATIRRVIDAAGDVPTGVWGRDEAHVGDMWNSNSVIAWLLMHADLDVDAGTPPDNGRAPGWKAGLHVARERTAQPVTADSDVNRPS